MPRLRGFLLLAAATVVWGATFPVVKRGLVGSAPMSFLALRFLVAGVVLAVILRDRSVRWPRSRWMVACSLALFAGYAFQTAGLADTSPARSAFITALSVILVPLVEPAFAINRFSWRSAAGAAVALAGLAVLLRPGVAPPTLGDCLTAGCAVAFAFHGVFLQAAVRTAQPASVNAAQVLATAALAAPAAAIEGWRFTLTTTSVLAIVVTGAVATVGAFWAMAEAQRSLSAAETAVVLAFEPVVAGVVSVALGEDSASLSLLLGGALVVVGVLVATVDPRGGSRGEPRRE